MVSAGVDAEIRRVLDPTGRPRFTRVVLAAATVRRVFDPTGRPRLAPVIAELRLVAVAVAVFLRAVDLRVVRLRAVRFGAGALAVSAMH
jgi:hypothetical protein